MRPPHNILCQHRDQFPAGLTSKDERHQQRLAHVRIETALEFLRIESGKSV